MIVAVCIDDNNGLLFNHRRLSRDRVQQEDLLALCGERPLRISPFSAPLFYWAGNRVLTDENFLQDAEEEDICFTEQPISDDARISALVLYRWNRLYPADTRLELDLSAFDMTEQVEFPGRSHEVITREWYQRRD